jgi:RNA polymerase sigma-70 factor (ECF subfamily)
LSLFRSKNPKKDDRAEREARQAFHLEAMVHFDALYDGARYMTRGGDEAQDLVQETLLKAFRFWDRYQQGTNCKAWLFRILTNTFINGTRKRRPMAGILDEVDSSERAFESYGAAGFYQSPETQAASRMVPERVTRAIEELPESFRVPVILADLQDFSYKEIAEILDCPVGTVMSRLHRGRQRLQEQLFDHAVEMGVIAKSDAALEDGTLSLDAYRSRRKARGQR